MGDELARDVAAISQIDAVPKLLEVVCRASGMGFAAVARVTEDRWVACAVQDNISFGLKAGGELAVATTICNEIRQSETAVVIDHVAEDDHFSVHPTPAQYGFQSYISVPIIYEGRFFGTLCAIDPSPARLRGTHLQQMFELFAELIGAHLTARERYEASQAALVNAVQAAELRDQFIAVLGHDLRNPLAGLDGGLRLLAKNPPPEKARTLLSHMNKSVWRMSSLIQDLMDFAKGRLGGGLDVRLDPEAPLRAALQEVVEEFRLSQPDRKVVATLELDAPVRCDAGRIAQLASNLLGNAFAHGSPDGEIRFGARTDPDRLCVWVANSGEPIPTEVQSRLFRPFFRGETTASGLGLGLYIAAEIAQAHGGALTVKSDAAETRFTFRNAAAPGRGRHTTRKRPGARLSVRRRGRRPNPARVGVGG